jgi:hypothetical protein
MRMRRKYNQTTISEELNYYNVPQGQNMSGVWVCDPPPQKKNE